MPNLPNQLPSDIDSLKALVAAQAALNEQLLAAKKVSDQENVRLGAKVLSLQEQLNLALAMRYAASSEKLSPIRFACLMKPKWMHWPTLTMQR